MEEQNSIPQEAKISEEVEVNKEIIEEPTPTISEQSTEQSVSEKNNSKTELNTGMAILAYIIFFIPLLTEAKNDEFVKFHVKQGFAVFLLSIILYALSSIVYYIFPFWFATLIYKILFLLMLGVIVLAVVGILNAANGKKEKLQIIGGFGDLLKI